MPLWLPLFVAMLYLLTGVSFFAVLRGRFSAFWALALLFIACQSHAFLLITTVSHDVHVLNLSIFNVISIFAWTVACLSFIWLWRKEMALGGIMISGINALLIFFAAVFQSNKPFLQDSSSGMMWHILLSIAAWTVLSIALIHSVLYLYIYQRLKNKQLRNYKMASLSNLERLSMNYNLLGCVLLFLSLLSGFVFVHDLFAQHLWHKTVFTIASALLYAWILFCYFFRLPRTLRLIYLSFVAYALLVTGYVVSNIVLQFVIYK